MSMYFHLYHLRRVVLVATGLVLYGWLGPDANVHIGAFIALRYLYHAAQNWPRPREDLYGHD